MTKLYILLGGNLGDKRLIFSEARKMLADRIGRVSQLSAVYETEPWGFKSEDLFWNQALEIETHLSPDEVLFHTRSIEHDLGRIRKENQYDSRVIDIDILFYGNQIINQDDLVIPHPRIQYRKFVLVPLGEIVPGLVHPVFQKNIRQLLEECTDQLSVQKLNIL